MVIHDENLSDMCGKRGSEPVERVPATSDPNTETQTIVTETNIHLHITFEPGELPSLRYFQIRIHGYPLATLVDSGSNQTLLGTLRKEIKIIRTFATTLDRDVQICTANGQEIKIPNYGHLRN